ncbi:uncharacterized protein LOC128584671 isoform X1 [Nycticebus coucang]|uniref:uncharacterized protein LOC128584671 isoform X1 n=1 Tax=Nycticebus coucang TaxID=9470 RepID=UPI00234CF78A|nr:uncharacterized protein LOC128584671 isoform X1 [Nycticebus coucang]XP_053445745.1 uncharacterized protein LOC128584671 isoform X1 [Nycticebus coucang]
MAAQSCLSLPAKPNSNYHPPSPPRGPSVARAFPLWPKHHARRLEPQANPSAELRAWPAALSMIRERIFFFQLWLSVLCMHVSETPEPADPEWSLNRCPGKSVYRIPVISSAPPRPPSLSPPSFLLDRPEFPALLPLEGPGGTGKGTRCPSLGIFGLLFPAQEAWMATPRSSDLYSRVPTTLNSLVWALDPRDGERERVSRSTSRAKATGRGTDDLVAGRPLCVGSLRKPNYSFSFVRYLGSGLGGPHALLGRAASHAPEPEPSAEQSCPPPNPRLPRALLPSHRRPDLEN